MVKVDKPDMVFWIQQRLMIVLSVYIGQFLAEGAEMSERDDLIVYSA